MENLIHGFHCSFEALKRNNLELRLCTIGYGLKKNLSNANQSYVFEVYKKYAIKEDEQLKFSV